MGEFGDVARAYGAILVEVWKNVLSIEMRRVKIVLSSPQAGTGSLKGNGMEAFCVTFW